MLETSDRDELIKWIDAAEMLKLQYRIETFSKADPRPNDRDREWRKWRLIILDLKKSEAKS